MNERELGEQRRIEEAQVGGVVARKVDWPVGGRCGAVEEGGGVLRSVPVEDVRMRDG